MLQKCQPHCSNMINLKERQQKISPEMSKEFLKDFLRKVKRFLQKCHLNTRGAKMTILRIGARFRQPSCNVRYCFLVFFCGYHITNKSVHYVTSESAPIVSNYIINDSCQCSLFYHFLQYEVCMQYENKIKFAKKC